MKTIKELEAEINLNKNFDLNNWKEDKTFDVGYREALKDVLGLIDERIRYHQSKFDRYDTETRVYSNNESQVKYSKTNAIKHMRIIDELEELKKRING